MLAATNRHGINSLCCNPAGRAPRPVRQPVPFRRRAWVSPALAAAGRHPPDPAWSGGFFRPAGAARGRTVINSAPQRGGEHTHGIRHADPHLRSRGAGTTATLPVMRASDHGMWQGSSVFDGARWFDGVCPDLAAHCARVNRSAEALMITPTLAAEEIEAIARDGLRAYDGTTAVYIRPMYWALHGSELGIAPKPGATGFAPCRWKRCRCRPPGPPPR